MYCLVLFLMTLVGGAVCLTWKPDYEGLYLNASFACGGPVIKISLEQIYRIEVSEEDPPTKACVLNFEADPIDNCSGLCYIFVPNAFVRRSEIQLSISSGDDVVMINSKNPVTIGPHCKTERTMAVNFTIYPGYVFRINKREFHFTLEVYNKCGQRGSVKNIKYEEAMKNMKGYEPSEMKEQERLTYIAGILLGFALASVFLCGLLIACCHARMSPSRGHTKSYDLPKAKSKPKPMEKKSADIEMKATYNTQDSGRENKPLLTATTSDPENPPTEDAKSATER